jgi:hypothetical protein
MLKTEIPAGFIEAPQPAPKPERRYAPRPKRKEDATLLSPEELANAFALGQLKKVDELDADLFTSVVRPGTHELGRLIETISTLETMRHGQETERTNFGGGINEVSLRTIGTGTESVRVIAKPQLGESHFTIRDGVATRLDRRWNAKQGKFETLESVFDENGAPYPTHMTLGIESMLKQSIELRREAAGFYGVLPEQVPINDQETSFRHGIAAGDLAFREVFAHRNGLITGLDVVPETTLLPNHAIDSDTGQITHRDIDVISAQKFVSPEVDGVSKGQIKAKRDELFSLLARDMGAYDQAIAEIKSVIKGDAPEAIEEKYLGWSRANLTNLLVVMGEEDNSKFEESSIRQMTAQEFENILREGPKHAYARDAMRIACLHYLVQATDGHIGNIIVDTTSREGRLKAVDNGLSATLSRRSEKANEYGEYEEPMDPYRSAMWEAAAKHPRWTLDKEAQENLRGLAVRLEGFKPVLQDVFDGDLTDDEISRKLGEAAGQGEGAAEFKYLFEMYTVLHKNKKIAAKEMLSYIKRLELLAKHGRPPNLPAPRDPMLPGNALFSYESLLDKYKPSTAQADESFRQAMRRFEDSQNDDRLM